MSESREQKLTQGSEVGGWRGKPGEGCRQSEASETQAEALFNPVLGEKGPKHQLLLRLWEPKGACDPDQSAGHKQ